MLSDPYSRIAKSCYSSYVSTTSNHLNLVLTNISELVPEGHLQELWQARSYDRLLATIESQTHPQSSSANARTTENSFFSFSFFGWSPFYIWVTICCIGTSLLFLKFIVVTYITIAYPGISQLLHRVGRSHIPVEHSSLALPLPVTPAPPSISSQLPSTRTLLSSAPRRPHLALACVEIDTSGSWPPRASLSPVDALSIGHHSFFIAQIPVVVNTIHMLTLIDTGASITVTSSEMTALLGVFHLNPSPIPCAVGMSGIPVKLCGCSPLVIQIGHVTIKHIVYFTDGPSVPKSAGTYNIILGNDLLRLLPRWNIDYSTKTFCLGDSVIHIMNLDAEEPLDNDETPVAVRVSQTTVLQPLAETLVPCFTQPNNNTLMLVSQHPQLADRSLMISPSVITAGNCRILITNPTNKTEIRLSRQRFRYMSPPSLR
ncbi:hypothetical protein Aduo_012742 [Ancylostoma duodenale]